MCVPLYPLLNDYYGLTVLLVLMAFLNVSTYVMIMMRLPVLIRYRLIALAHAIGSSYLASSVPFVATVLWQYKPIQSYQLIYLFILFSAAIFAAIQIRNLKKTAL
jgi:hypothetical protein